ncbi:hypothetical protein HC123_04910 [Lactobacillus crispatus]|nr:hypothetical protein [Lactobacillus crispatus]
MKDSVKMKYTQEQLKQVTTLPKLTQCTKFFDGMRIFTVLKAEKGGVITRRGYNLLADEILLMPNDRDWQEWQKYPDNSNKSYYDLDQNDYWVIADVNDLADRSLMSTKEILKMELELPQRTNNVFVTYSA